MMHAVRHWMHHARSLQRIGSQFSRSQSKYGTQTVEHRTQRWFTIEITKTESSKDTTSSSCGSAPSESKLKKTNQQQAEEELMTLNSHVKQHYQHANFTEALNVSNEVLTKSMDLFGKNHPAIASAYNNIGLMQKMMGDFEEARTNYHKALNIYQDIVGKDHASYAAALSNLGSLDRAQSMTDENLSSLERLQLNESAVEYFEESWKIRKAELGNEHPQTIMSQSNLGGAIAAQVLQGELFRQRQSKTESEGNDKHVNMGTMSRFTKEKWDLAEQNLRMALQTAVQISNDNKNSVLPPRRDNSLSRKEKQKASKLRKKLEKQASQEMNDDDDTSIVSRFGMGNTSIQTLTAAAAAQNLAVFLKSRADLLSNSTQLSKDANLGDDSANSEDMYVEAKNLYLGALHVRTKLRGKHHPDTISTKFSLAELIGAIGDEAGANELRQELLDTYEVEERDMNNGRSETS
jgi:tetratricopeptide (TPR) repeat protein